MFCPDKTLAVDPAYLDVESISVDVYIIHCVWLEGKSNMGLGDDVAQSVVWDSRFVDPRFEPRKERKQNPTVYPSRVCCADSLSVSKYDLAVD